MTNYNDPIVVAFKQKLIDLGIFPDSCVYKRIEENGDAYNFAEGTFVLSNSFAGFISCKEKYRIYWYNDEYEDETILLDQDGEEIFRSVGLLKLEDVFKRFIKIKSFK